MTKKKQFSKGVEDHLGHYVYGLIDPRDGKTFYVGKGQDHRVFAHINDTLGPASKPSDKLERIKDIKKSGGEVKHLIYRHGMNKEAAEEVEAALIDALRDLTVLPDLTNEIRGKDADRGLATIDQIEERYNAEPMDPTKLGDKLLFIKITDAKVKETGSVYETVRSCWKINVKRAEQADYVIAVINGFCRGVFTVRGWQISSKPGCEGRKEFVGNEVNSSDFKGKLIPSEYCKKGRPESNPLQLVNCATSTEGEKHDAVTWQITARRFA